MKLLFWFVRILAISGILGPVFLVSGGAQALDEKESSSAFAVQEDQGQRPRQTSAQQSFVLNILHINDHHSHLEPNDGELDFDGVPTDVETGGFARVVTAMNLGEKYLNNLLKLHAGDAITGTVYYSLFKGEPDARLMNQICFDAFALGNHEFDDGDAGLASFLSMLNTGSESCQTPVLAANVIPAFGTPLYPALGNSLIQPYTIKAVGGEPVGIIGIDIAGKTKNSSSPLESTQFLDETSTAQYYIDELSTMGVNKIILLTHYQYENDVELAKNLRGVDIIVGGDSHSLLGERFADFGLNPVGPYPTKTTNVDGDPVCVVQAWQYSDIVGHLTARFDSEGRILDCQGTPLMLLGNSFERDGMDLSGADLRRVLEIVTATPELFILEPDPSSSALLSDYSDQVEVLKQTVVGVVEKDLCLERVPGDGRSALCPVEATQANGGDIQQLVTHAFLKRSFEADVALQNAGGVRIDLPAGEITIDTVYTLLPFANTLVNLDMMGWEVKQVLEEAVSNFADNEGSTGSYPYAANLRWTLDMSRPVGERFSNIEIRRKDSERWEPLKDDDRLKVVTNSFIAAGRDGYFTFRDVTNDGRAVDTYIDYAQGFIDYLQQDLGGANPGDPVLIDPPRVGALPCGDYSTQVFINEDGLRQEPDPLIGRACTAD